MKRRDKGEIRDLYHAVENARFRSYTFEEFKQVAAELWQEQLRDEVKELEKEL